MAVFEATQKADTVKVALRLVGEEAPHLTAAPDLQDQAARAVDRAWELHLRAPWDASRFALLTILFGEGFEQSAEWARQILGNDALTPTGKVDELESFYQGGRGSW
jgi:hypothetical protein